MAGNTLAIVLAAGKGTRMRSRTPKVLHKVGGLPMIEHVLAAANEAGVTRTVLVVAPDSEWVDALPDAPRAFVQDPPQGMAHAVLAAREAFAATPEAVVVLYGDNPLITPQSIARALDAVRGGADVAVVAFRTDAPTGYGRVLMDDGQVVAIREEADASSAEKAVTLCNSGVMAIAGGAPLAALDEIGAANAKGEYYLTDLVGLARDAGLMVGAHLLEDVVQTEGANDRAQLAGLGRLLNDRVVERWMREGVTVVDPATTWIDVGVELERDVTILPGTQLLGSTSVGEDSVVGPDSTLRDCRVGRSATLTRVHGDSAEIGDGASVGPYSYLRPGTRLGADGKIGGFVETKNAVIGDGAKVPHLSYIGDAEIGEGTNIGAGTITANYDGVAKHRTVVGKHARTGSNNTFVAPTTIGDGASTGGGTVVRGDVPPGALAVSSGPMRVIDGWAEDKRAGTAQGEAAAAARRTSDDHDVTDPSSQPPARDLG